MADQRWNGERLEQEVKEIAEEGARLGKELSDLSDRLRHVDTRLMFKRIDELEHDLAVTRDLLKVETERREKAWADAFAEKRVQVYKERAYSATRLLERVLQAAKDEGNLHAEKELLLDIQHWWDVLQGVKKA